MIEFSLVTSLENKIYFLPFWITSSSSFVRNFSPEYNRNETTVNSDNIIRVLNIKKFVLRNDLNFSPSWKLGWNDSIYRSQPWPSQTFFKILPATRLIPFSRHCFPPELWTPAHNTKLGLIADTLSHETLEKELNKTSSSSSRIIIENAIREKWNGDTDLRLVSRLTTASPSPPSFPYRFQAINISRSDLYNIYNRGQGLVGATLRSYSRSNYPRLSLGFEGVDAINHAWHEKGARCREIYDRRWRLYSR